MASKHPEAEDAHAYIPAPSSRSLGPAILMNSFDQVPLDPIDERDLEGLVECDECEEAPASILCDPCGLVYCDPCDAWRHRKGKLTQHERVPLHAALISDERPGSTASSPIETGLEKRGLLLSSRGLPVLELRDAEQLMPDHQGDTQDIIPWEERVPEWTVHDVQQWLQQHELDMFAEEVDAHGIDGGFLLSEAMDQFVETQSNAARGHKKKLLREIQKLKNGSPSSRPSPESTPFSLTGSNAADSSLYQEKNVGIAQPSLCEPRSCLRVELHGGNRVRSERNDHKRPISPVTAWRSSLTHGQEDASRGRPLGRRRSAHPSLESARPAPLAIQIDPQEQTNHGRRSHSVISVDTSNRHDLQKQGGEPIVQSGRPGFGALNLDIQQVKREEKAVEASFDFSAEGRLQTKGFEINTDGIANVPFGSANVAKPTPLNTREFLVMLKELGHGASGKVYKALFVPSFKLVAVKVIRIYDQTKRHQMVRELQSLYMNYVPLSDPHARGACEELVIFHDAYTNPETGSVSIVLEYMDGGSLEDRYMESMTKARRPERCSEAQLARMAYGVLKGLAFLHEHHQLHRDIKPSNMLINRQGQVKISDFGISRDLESTLAKATTFTGTLLYMAPERISGGMYSYPSDIWSFGLALMACAIGKLPVPTQDGYWGVVHAVQEQPSPKLMDYDDQFSAELCDFLDQCLQKNPMLRPPAAKLLEHPFIVNNCKGVSPSAPLSKHGHLPSFSTDQPLPQDQQDDVLAIATQVRKWCQAHAEQILARTGAFADVFHATSTDKKLATLAHQLGVPERTITEHFAFLHQYDIGAASSTL